MHPLPGRELTRLACHVSSENTLRENEMLHVGDRAPDFSLSGSDGLTYTLEQFRGEKAVLLAFFPKAFTSG